jgi:subtilisin family serine protease
MRRSAFVSKGFLLVALLSARPLGAEGRKVAREVEEALERDGPVRVVVELADRSSSRETLDAKSRAWAATQARFLATLSPERSKVRYRCLFSPTVVLELSGPAAVGEIERAEGVEGVFLDLEGSGSLEQSRELVRAREAQEMTGLTGAGLVVAVLDSGAKTDHPDLAGAVIHEHHFLDQGGDVGPGAADGHGHGTNVTSILAGRGVVAPPGIAPGALIVAIKVLDDANRGWVTDWVAGVEEVVRLHRAEGGIKVDVINMSLATNSQFASACDGSLKAYAAACSAAAGEGILVFGASGNRGSETEMSAPACLSSVFSVGSVLDEPPDRVSSFTNRNARLDILAPGQPITAAGVRADLSTFSGTSQACPHVAGAACLLLEARPEMSSGETYTLLGATGVPVFDPATGLTFPRLDVLAAVEAAGEDCNRNGVADLVDLLVARTSADCNDNLAPDECDIESGASLDTDGDRVPDECPGVLFHRGDPDGSGVSNLGDAVFLFNFLFLGDAAPRCRESADTDNDHHVNVSDGISLMNHLFLDGPPPAPPGSPLSACGPDPDPPGTRGDLGCGAYDRC